MHSGKNKGRLRTAVIISLLITMLSLDSKSLRQRFAVCIALSGVARSSEDASLISARFETFRPFLSGRTPVFCLKLPLHI